jgi:hypothetical protein
VTSQSGYSVKLNLARRGETTLENMPVHLTVRLKSVTLIFALAISGIALSSTSAKADDFSFSFTNTVWYGVPGTVTGEILGLTNNATGPATEVLITSFPAGLDTIVGSGPINAMLWNYQEENSFTVSGGEVTAGGFWAQQEVNGFPKGLQLFINGGTGTFNYINYLNLDGTDTHEVWGNNGLAAANIASRHRPGRRLWRLSAQVRAVTMRFAPWKDMRRILQKTSLR